MGRTERVEPAVLANVLLEGLLEHWPDAASQMAALRENLVLQVEETNMDIMTIGDDLPLFRLMHEQVWGQWGEDPLFGKGTVRQDGRKVHPAYLMEVKKPAESKAPWDYYKIRSTIPADEAFRPLGKGECPLVKT